MKMLGEPLRTPIRRKDGAPISPNLPTYAVQPVTFKVGTGIAQIVDLGFAFVASDKPKWEMNAFAIEGGNRPPEFIGKCVRVAQPKKVDSWAMGLLVSCISIPSQLSTLNNTPINNLSSIILSSLEGALSLMRLTTTNSSNKSTRHSLAAYGHFCWKMLLVYQ
jgi:hypothetical protein